MNAPRRVQEELNIWEKLSREFGSGCGHPVCPAPSSLRVKGQIPAGSSEPFLFQHPNISQDWILNPLLGEIPARSFPLSSPANFRVYKHSLPSAFSGFPSHVFAITEQRLGRFKLLHFHSLSLFVCLSKTQKPLEAFGVLGFVTSLAARAFVRSPWCSGQGFIQPGVAREFG